MENSYGIGVANRYELFYDEDVDPMDLISQSVATEKENKTKGGVKAVKGPAGKKATKTEVNNKIAEKIEPFGNAGRGRGGDNRVKFSDREERNNRRNRPEGEYRQPGEFRQGGDFNKQGGGEFRDGERPAPRFDGERGRGRGRGGMGRGRGRGRGGAGPDGRGKREFDRQSGMATTGVKAVDKRDGSGSYNWGSDKELVEENLNAEVSDHDTSAENAEKVEEGAPTEGEEAKTEEEQAREMTLDEYKAMQKATKAKPAFNVRKPGEGENQTQWKKTYVLKKKIEEDEGDEDDEEEEEAHHGRRKVVLDIDFQFSDSPARGRGRGRGRGGDRGRGRGGDRGGFERRGGMGGGRGGGEGRGGEGRGMDTEPRGRGRGGPRGGRGMGRQEAPKMDDERDFPSLG